MKKVLSFVSVITLVLVCLTACGQPAATGIWADATYTEDTTLGTGATTLTVVVSAEDKEVTFTVHTDKDTVGAALSACGLIEGADGMYTVVNGMTADYTVDQTYWAFYENDGYATEGMDTTAIEAGVTYKLVRSK